MVNSRKNRNVVIGADPGKRGYIAILDIDTFVPRKHADITFVKASVKDGKLDCRKMASDLSSGLVGCNVKYVIQELVHALFGSSAKGTFEFGDSNGSLRTMLQLVINDKDIALVAPKEWQSIAWAGVEPIVLPKIDPTTKLQKLNSKGELAFSTDTKATSLLAAHSLFPDVSFCPPRCKKEHDGAVDAALLAYTAYVYADKK